MGRFGPRVGRESRGGGGLVAAAPSARHGAADLCTRRIALGVFDGVHLGHREVIRGADCVVTFDPHPMRVLAPDLAPPA